MEEVKLKIYQRLIGDFKKRVNNEGNLARLICEEDFTGMEDSHKLTPIILHPIEKLLIEEKIHYHFNPPSINRDNDLAIDLNKEAVVVQVGLKTFVKQYVFDALEIVNKKGKVSLNNFYSEIHKKVSEKLEISNKDLNYLHKPFHWTFFRNNSSFSPFWLFRDKTPDFKKYLDSNPGKKIRDFLGSFPEYLEYEKKIERIKREKRRYPTDLEIQSFDYLTFSYFVSFHGVSNSKNTKNLCETIIEKYGKYLLSRSKNTESVNIFPQ